MVKKVNEGRGDGRKVIGRVRMKKISESEGLEGE
jgi:hypothetical protein